MGDKAVFTGKRIKYKWLENDFWMSRYFLLEIVVFHRYVSSREGKWRQ